MQRYLNGDWNNTVKEKSGKKEKTLNVLWTENKRFMYLYCFYFATEIGQFTDLIER